MTRIVWRTMAGVLALAIGGFVVSAQDKCPKPAASDKAPCNGCPIEAKCPCDCPCPAQCPAQCPCPTSCPAPAPTLAPLVSGTFTPPDEIPPQIVQEKCVQPTPVFMASVIPVAATNPYKVRIEMVGATTEIELVRGDKVAMRVECERVTAQMPSGGLEAIGKVTVATSGITVRCNRVMIGWQTGEITMDGQVRITYFDGHHQSEMATESVCWRLNGIGTAVGITPQPAPIQQTSSHQ